MIKIKINIVNIIKVFVGLIDITALIVIIREFWFDIASACVLLGLFILFHLVIIKYLTS